MRKFELNVDLLVPALTANIYNVMRILSKKNPGDLYINAYRSLIQETGAAGFFDLYCLNWIIGANMAPKRILEVGTRTGISLAQLLSSYIDHSVIEKIVSVDLFNDDYISPALVVSNLKALALPTEKICFYPGDSREQLPSLQKGGELFDYVLVDGDHSVDGATIDLENAHPLVAPGGVLVFDDITPGDGKMGLLPVWEAFESKYSNEYTFDKILAGKGVAWAVKKTTDERTA